MNKRIQKLFDYYCKFPLTWKLSSKGIYVFEEIHRLNRLYNR